MNFRFGFPSRSGLLPLVLVLAVLCGCNQQVTGRCVLPQASDLGNTSVPSDLPALIATTVSAGDSSSSESPIVQLFEFNIVCLAVAEERDLYRYASVVAEFSCSGAPSAISPLDCDSSGTTNYTAQFDLECNIDAGTARWILAVSTLSGSTATNVFQPPNANLTTALTTDCSFCIDPARSTAFMVDITADSHCSACDSSCLESPEGQELCYGTGSAECCNVYESNMCMVSCSPGRQPQLQANGKTLVCELVCDDLPDPANGSVSYSPSGFPFLDTVATYNCNESYEVSSPSTQTCVEGLESTVQWSPSAAPTCTILDCGSDDLTDSSGVFPNGVVATPSGTTFGEVATYTCNPEYELIGDEQRTCGVGGWSGAIPECATCNPVCVNGDCVNQECVCRDGYTGDACDMRPCLPPCENGGTCNDGTCACTSGFTGDDCGVLVCPDPKEQYFPPNCTLCSEVFGVDCEECDEEKCTKCANGDLPGADGKCTSGKPSSGGSSGGGCEIGCIIGIVIAAIILAILLAALVAVIIYAIYKYKINPATKLSKHDGDGLNGVARDNPLYVDPSTVEEEVETGGDGGEATGL